MKKSRLLGAVCIYLLSASAQASLVSFHMIGFVTSADLDNAYGLSVGDTITASGEYESDGQVEGEVLILFTGASGNLLRFDVGNFVYRHYNDIDYTVGPPGDSVVPAMTLIDGEFDSFNYIGELFGQGNSDLFLTSTEWLVEDGSDLEITVRGEWDANSFVITAIPIPPALWLFGSGMLGLIGFTRRKKAA